MSKIFKSILYWPEQVFLCNSDNSSSDTHIDEAGAIEVCKTLIRKGLGCNRQHFPIKAIAMSGDEIIFEWNKDEGYIKEISDPYNYCDEMRKHLFNK